MADIRPIEKLLVANRGEIAVRIIRTAKRIGIRTVAVFSDADRYAPFVHFADEAVYLGPSPARESYLVMEKILKAARDTGANAIHPGYGFLSENAEFADAVEAAGLIFVGPSANAMRIMGGKIPAKQAVQKFNVPLVPGTAEAIRSIEEGLEIARQIGFPILIKASAGGGGKGMRVVEKAEDFAEQMSLAQSEALSAFGDDAVFMERYVANPKHIEIQVIADKHGNALYLFERECSVQRRHQKVVEEAPSSCLTPEIRKKMGEAAVDVCRACGYSNAGTVEFLVDDDLNFYFLEMNTRLQVEHPVTESITGLDLVELQLKVASGEPLTIRQEDLSINGHAIEIRVYAEDPENNFLPDIGTLEVYQAPTGPGIRVDDGYAAGMPVPIFYDPMLAKLIVHAPTRSEAIDGMIKAIDQYRIVGVRNTLDFCKFVMSHEAFRAGRFDTHFVSKYYTPEKLPARQPLSEQEARLVAALAALLEARQENMI